MVFSPELGYDPEEWEECGESDHFLAFGFFTRIWLTLVTVGLAGAFFWILEARKEWSKLDRENEKDTILTTKEEKEPPPKPERRMSLEAMKAAEEMRREAAAIYGEPEIQSPQRDARSSISVERRLRQGAPLTREEVEAMLEADKKAVLRDQEGHPISPEPPSTSFALPHGAFDNITELQDLDKLSDPQKKQSLEQQYRVLAKTIEQKLLAEIEQLGLLNGRHNEKDAPRQIAEQIQQKHQTEIFHAVDELVRREAGDIPYVADHFRKQLENQIEDAVWQYNQSLLNTSQPKDLYETELGPNEEPIWKQRQQQQQAADQADFDFATSVFDKSQEATVEGVVPLYKQKPQGLQVPPRPTYEPPEDATQQRPSEPSSPKTLINSQQKGSSSSEENGFIKVYPEQTLPQQQQQHQPGHESPGAIGSPRPSSYDAGSSVTADDIEFVHSADNSPRITDYPDVFGYENLQTIGKNNRHSDDLEGFETIPSQNIWQQQHPQQQMGVEGSTQKQPLNPEEIIHMRQLLNEYDLNSIRESEAEDLRQVKQQSPSQTQHQQQQQSLPPEIWQKQDTLLQQQQPQQPQFQEPQAYQDSQFQQKFGQPEQPQFQQSEAYQESSFPKHLQYSPQQGSEFQQSQLHQHQPLLQQAQHQQSQFPQSQLQQQHPQQAQQQQYQPQPDQQQPLQAVPEQKQTSKRSKSKSPIQAFHEGDNIAEFLFQMPLKNKQPQTNEQATYSIPPKQQGIEGQQQSLERYENLVPQQQDQKMQQRQEPDDDPRRLAAADIYIQDAIEYIESQQQRPATSQSGGGGGFIIEEDMLESDKMSPQPSKDFNNLPPPFHDAGPNLSELEKQLKSPSEAAKHSNQQNASADPTSKMIRTNEIFTRPEPSFDDADDAITSAPEIQSIEIPPDQMSENSSNIMDNYDFQPGSSGAYSPPLLIHPPEIYESENNNFITNNNHHHFEIIDNDRLMAASPSSPRPASSQSSRNYGDRSPEPPMLHRVSPIPYDETPSLSMSERHIYMRKQSSLLSVLHVTSMQEMLLTLTSLEDLAAALRKAGLESTNIIFGIDYTASNKYQGENSFGGRSLHSVKEPSIENPYQQVIRIMGHSLASFATAGSIPVYGFGDASTGDWSVFKLKEEGGECHDLDEVLRVYNEVTPKVELSGPTNFAPLIYEAMKICQKIQDYHVLIIIADGQVTNERATRKAIVKACEYPLSIIVVGIGDGPWNLMKVFDESLPKRPWDNFHFVEFNEIVRERERSSTDNELAFAIQTLLEIPDQYAMIRRLGLIGGGSRVD
jgi:E3 ubiquitin-protein ligase RGLG